ncbi:MAG: calcium-binding protein, partial [Roseomonas sp.]|nr:calcium-binding protein [Roseomonas sp.]
SLVAGAAPNQTLLGDLGHDTLVLGNSTAQAALGGEGNDCLLGSTAANTLEGSDGDDTLNGGGDSDFALGGAGNDYVYAVIGTNVGVGGSGNDTLDTSALTANYLVNLQTGLNNSAGESFTEFEAVIAGAGNDTLIGTDGANFMNGGAGNDSILGGNGADTLIGGGGTDFLSGGNGDDVILVGVDLASILALFN